MPQKDNLKFLDSEYITAVANVLDIMFDNINEMNIIKKLKMKNLLN